MSGQEQVKSAGGIAPFGYRWQNGRLTVDEREASVRRLLYELFLKHRRKKTVARLLDELGHKTRSGAKFSDTTVDRLLRDTTAKGVKIIDGRAVQVEPIVDCDVWERANGILNANAAQKTARQAVQLFAGLTFCSCGGKMIVPGNLDKYVCPKCRRKIPINDLEEIVHSRLQGVAIPADEDDAETGHYNLGAYWHYLDRKEKRLIVEHLVDSITVDEREIVLCLIEAADFSQTATSGQQASGGNETETVQMDAPKQEPVVAYINEPLLSEAKAAEFLGISKMTLLRKRNAGEIGFFRVGFRVLYSKEKHLLPYLFKCERAK